MSETEQPNNDCCICLGVLQDDPQTRWTCMQCSGSTHLSCMAQALIRNPNPEVLTCPMCRHEHNLQALDAARGRRGSAMARPAVARLLAMLLSATTLRSAPTLEAAASSAAAENGEEEQYEGEDGEEEEEEEEQGGGALNLASPRLALHINSTETHIHVHNIIFRC